MSGMIPEGWVETTVGNYLHLKNGFAFKSSWYKEQGELTVPVIRISDINGKYASEVKAAHISSDNAAKGFEIKYGDLLIAMSGATTGKVGVYTSKQLAYQNQRVGNLKLNSYDNGSASYRNYLISNLTPDILKIAYGGAQPNISGKAIEGMVINLPPLAEQKVIADKLDELLAQVESTKARLDAIPAILKSFRQSVLATAVSGKLTEAWRGGESNKNVVSGIYFDSDEKTNIISTWKWRKLTDIARLESGHTPRKSIPEYWDEGDIPWISLQDIRAAHGTVITQTKFMPNALGIENSSARLLPAGTVCFCRDISVGFTTVMGTEMSTTQHFANWVCGNEVNNLYMLYAFMASKEHLTRSGQGTTVKTIYMPALKRMEILLPPKQEQTEIVRRVEELFAFADKVEAQVNEAQARVNNLTQSILAKAFSGELTADWRAQNPDLISGKNSAAALLERIKAERDALAKSGKTKKKTIKKKATK